MTTETDLRRLILAAALVCLAACSTPGQPGGGADKEQGFVSCQAPRPEICTREYQPVCGHVDTSIRCITTPCDSAKHHTYGNACSACADPAVIGYEFGSCESYGK